MNERIHVEEDALNELKNSLATAGEKYKEELAKLTNLIEEITRGDIQGDLADDLLEKFNSKQEDFKLLAQAVEEAQEKVGVKGTDFTTMVTNMKESNQ